MKSELIFTQPVWLVLICIALGIGYAWLLYSVRNNRSKVVNRLLAVIRAVLVALICFLLLNPLLRSNSTRTIKPMMVVGIDNSGSINTLGSSEINQLKDQISAFRESLNGSDFDIEVRNLEGEKIENIDSIRFNLKKTDIGVFFREVSEEFEGQNLRKVVLLSDGIVNSGLSPLNKTYPFQIDVIGVGDTTVRKDLILKGLTANKLAYLGNSFPVEAEISAKLYSGQSTVVLIKQENEILARQNIAFNTDDDFKVVQFIIPASKIGKQRYQVEILPLSGESSIQNNRRDIIVDVVDGKEKIFLLSLAPHPDVKALRAIMEKNELFEVNVKSVAFDEPSEILNTEFDILVLHQLPSLNSEYNTLVSRVLSKMKPTFFILGKQTNLSVFNGMQEVMSVSSQGNKTDQVTASFNTGFNRYKIDNEVQSVVSSLPPLSTPFGEYGVFPGSDVIIQQKIGSLTTDRPLLVLNTNVNRKSAVLAGEGIWQWRMEEYLMNDEQVAIDEVVLKTLQLISVKEDKEKLRVYPTQDVFDVDESVIFQTEIYDDLYERISEGSLTLEINGSGEYRKTFNYEVSEDNSTFEISELPAGVYSYRAQGTVLGKNESSSGQFVVRDIDLEFINTTADFGLLRTLASNSQGNFYSLNDLEALEEDIKSESLPARLINTEDLREIINLRWLLPLLILLATIEWGYRKFLGGY